MLIDIAESDTIGEYLCRYFDSHVHYIYHHRIIYMSKCFKCILLNDDRIMKRAFILCSYAAFKCSFKVITCSIVYF